MANRLKMADGQSIIALARLGWSYRRFAAEVGVDRETVSRHVRGRGEGMAVSVLLHDGTLGQPEPPAEPPGHGLKTVRNRAQSATAATAPTPSRARS
jgi:hypothetical protein